MVKVPLIAMPSEAVLLALRSQSSVPPRVRLVMPGARPVEMLAEALGHEFGRQMAKVHKDLQDGDDALRYWLRDYRGHDTAFLLAVLAMLVHLLLEAGR